MMIFPPWIMKVMFLVKKAIMVSPLFLKEKLNNIRTDLIKDKLKQSRIISAEIEYKKKSYSINKYLYT